MLMAIFMNNWSEQIRIVAYHYPSRRVGRDVAIGLDWLRRIGINQHFPTFGKLHIRQAIYLAYHHGEKECSKVPAARAAQCDYM